MNKKELQPKPTLFFCFSPPVMLFTFLFEFFGATYTAVRYKLDRTARLVIYLLICLGIFQLAEYLICESIGLTGLSWARIGYVSITLLPPLGISLASSIAKKQTRILQITTYLFCAAFIVYFLFIKQSLTGQVCNGNYVIFNSTGSMFPYGAYYYILLALGTTLCFYWARESKNKKTRRALASLAIGYLAFITPTVAVNLINPETIAGIPSIMCGFALLLAAILLFLVLPAAGTLRNSTKPKSSDKSQS